MNEFMQLKKAMATKEKKVFISQVTRDKTEAEVLAQREAAMAWLKSQVGDFAVINVDFSRLSPYWESLLIKLNIAVSDLALFIGDFENGEVAPLVFATLEQKTPFMVYQT
jgi:hypothetical protein